MWCLTVPGFFTLARNRTRSRDSRSRGGGGARTFGVRSDERDRPSCATCEHALARSLSLLARRRQLSPKSGGGGLVIYGCSQNGGCGQNVHTLQKYSLAVKQIFTCMQYCHTEKNRNQVRVTRMCRSTIGDCSATERSPSSSLLGTTPLPCLGSPARSTSLRFSLTTPTQPVEPTSVCNGA